MRRANRLLLALTCAAAGLAAGGCVMGRAVAAPVKLAAKTVVGAGETTGAVVSSGGKIIGSGARALGAAGGAGLDAAAKLAREDMVTFVNASDGRVSRVAWREGMRLGAAAATGRVELAGRALEIIRDGRVVLAAKHAADAIVAAGDVVRLLY